VVSAITALVAAAWNGLPLMLWAAALAVVAGGLSWWVHTLRTGVSVTLDCHPSRVFIGEEAEVRLTITNERRLPLPIVRIDVPVPEGLATAVGGSPTAYRGHRRRLSVAGRRRVEVALPLRARQRGEFWLDAASVTLCDPFDLAAVRLDADVVAPLLVMPRASAETTTRVTPALPFGRPAPGMHLFEDREHFAGVRDYEPGDPVRLVHWRASAHAGALQTKQFEPARSAEVVLAIDLSVGEPFWREVDGEAAELTIGLAASIARRALHAGWRTGVLANTHLRRGRGPLRVRPSTAAGHEAALFAALARMPAQPTSDLGPVVREFGKSLPRRSSVIVVSPNPGASLRHEIVALRRRGVDVVHLSPTDPLLEGDP
jgi:uncharacterized protein (DUF58 family)